MENIHLILTDLDGTLFHSDKSISEYTKQIIGKAKQKGIHFGISTSRGRDNCLPYLKELHPDIIISNGGALTYYGDKIIYRSEFSIEQSQKIFNSIYSTLGNVEITADNETQTFWNRKPEEQSTDYQWNSIYDDFKNFTEPVMKICFQTTDKEKAELIASSIGREHTDLIPFSDIPWFKLSSRNATKENAIKSLSSSINIPVEQIVSFGDDFNDMGMIKLCGTGIAMANAIDEIKKTADFVTLSNDEDGVARWIETNLL